MPKLVATRVHRLALYAGGHTRTLDDPPNSPADYPHTCSAHALVHVTVMWVALPCLLAVVVTLTQRITKVSDGGETPGNRTKALLNGHE